MKRIKIQVKTGLTISEFLIHGRVAVWPQLKFLSAPIMAVWPQPINTKKTNTFNPKF